MLREHLGFETDEVCKELGVTATHCWVRSTAGARRLCLDKTGSADDAHCARRSRAWFPRVSIAASASPSACGCGVHLAICDGCTNFKKQMEFCARR